MCALSLPMHGGYPFRQAKLGVDEIPDKTCIRKKKARKCCGCIIGFAFKTEQIVSSKPRNNNILLQLRFLKGKKNSCKLHLSLAVSEISV